MTTFKNLKCILGFSAKNHIFCCIDTDGNLTVNNKKIDKLESHQKKYSLWIYNNYLLVDDRYGQIFIYNHITGDLLFKTPTDERELYIGNTLSIYEKNKIRVIRYKNSKKHYATLDLENFQLENIPFNFEISLENIVFTRDSNENSKNTVFAFDKKSGKKIWQFSDFRSGLTNNIGAPMDEVAHDISGIYDDLLWVILTGGRVVGLDPDTGKIIRQFTSDNADYGDFLNNNEKIPPYLPLGPAAFLPNEGLMIGINDRGYCEIDLSAQQPVWKAYRVDTSFEDHGFLGIMKIRDHGQCIYFSESMGSRIGMFDRTLKKVTWSDDIKNHNPDAGTVFEVKATDTHLYIQDSKNNLYIYDRKSLNS